MTVHTAVYDTGDILWTQFDRLHLIYMAIKTVGYELQYLLTQRWVYVPENHNEVRNQRRTE